MTRDQVISALLDLVTIDEQGRPTKRRVALDRICAADVTDELEPFIERRLLSTEADGERTFVGVAARGVSGELATAERRDRRAGDRAAGAPRGGKRRQRLGSERPRRSAHCCTARQLAKATVDIGAELEPVTASSGDAASGRNGV